MTKAQHDNVPDAKLKVVDGNGGLTPLQVSTAANRIANTINDLTHTRGVIEDVLTHYDEPEKVYLISSLLQDGQFCNIDGKQSPRWWLWLLGNTPEEPRYLHWNVELRRTGDEIWLAFTGLPIQVTLDSHLAVKLDQMGLRTDRKDDTMMVSWRSIVKRARRQMRARGV